LLDSILEIEIPDTTFLVDVAKQKKHKDLVLLFQDSSSYFRLCIC